MNILSCLCLDFMNFPTCAIIRTHVCTYVCMSNIPLYVHTYVCTVHVCTYVLTYVRMYCMYIHMCVHVRTYVYVLYVCVTNIRVKEGDIGQCIS